MGLLAGCLIRPFYTVDRTVDAPSLTPKATGRSSKGLDPWNLGEPFHFTDPGPRVLIIGHVEVRRDGIPAEGVGAILFDAKDYDDNLTSLSEVKAERVNFVSGDWFAGKIFAGNRRIYRISINIDEQRVLTPAAGIYRGCGRRIFAGLQGWDFHLNMDDATKAYYLGHITIHEEPSDSFFVAGYIRVEVSDRADEFADFLRGLVGERVIEKALLPDCPE